MRPRVPRFADDSAFLYRRREIEVSAFQWSGAPPGIEEPEWVAEAIIGGTMTLGSGTLLIRTDAGVLKALPGDWIVRDADGAMAPVKPAAFARAYRRAEAGTPEPTDRGGRAPPA